MLTMQWQYLSFLFSMLLFIFHSSTVLANSKPFLLRESQNKYSIPGTIISNNNLFENQQKQPSNLLQQLNLTKEQQQQIRQIHYRYMQQIRQKRNNLVILQQQLSDMMAGTEPINLIRAKNQQLVTLQQEIGILRFESMLATREILTPQQRQKFRKLVKSHLSQ